MPYTVGPGCRSCSPPAALLRLLYRTGYSSVIRHKQRGSGENSTSEQMWRVTPRRTLPSAPESLGVACGKRRGRFGYRARIRVVEAEPAATSLVYTRPSADEHRCGHTWRQTGEHLPDALRPLQSARAGHVGRCAWAPVPAIRPAQRSAAQRVGAYEHPGRVRTCPQGPRPTELLYVHARLVLIRS